MFGELVRAHRRRLGLTQRELAEKTGLGERSIRKLEGGRIATPRPATVRLLAGAFGLVGTDRDRFYQATTPAPPVRDGEHPTPAQLPLDPNGFVGRAAALAALDAALDAALGRTAIATISGTAGIGKTTLAVHWAHRVAHRFPDGQLYVNLRGFDPGGAAVDLAGALRDFFDALAVDPRRVPDTAGAQAALYRSLLAGRRMLIVLDNARDSDHVRDLLPGAPGCLVLVTSRSLLTGLRATHGAHLLTLDLLPPDEARALLVRRLDADRVDAEPDAARQLVAACARLPLALTIAAARAHETGFPLATLATEMRDAGQRLDALDTGDPATRLRSVLSWSYAALTQPAARLFRLLGLHPGPEICTAAAASLAGLRPDQTGPPLTELTRASLLTERMPGRYAFHDLLHAYAAEQARSHDAAGERRAATARLLDFYLDTGYAAARSLNPSRDPITLAATPPGAAPAMDHQRALDWFAAERPALLAAVHHAFAEGMDTHAWKLACTLRTFLYRRGRWHDEAAAGATALAATRRLGDPAAQIHAHRLLAVAHTHLGRFDDADADLRCALEVAVAGGDRLGQARIYLSLAHLAERRGDPAGSIDHGRQALDIYRAGGHRTGTAHALNMIGWAHGLLGDYALALSCCQRALTLYQGLGHRDGQATTWDSLGYAHHHLGQHDQARACYRRALALYRELGNRYDEADALTHLGDTHRAHGDTRAARAAWRQALAIRNELGDPDARSVRARLDALDPPISS